MKLAVTAQGKDLDAALGSALWQMSVLYHHRSGCGEHEASSINIRRKLEAQVFNVPNFLQIMGSMFL